MVIWAEFSRIPRSTPAMRALPITESEDGVSALSTYLFSFSSWVVGVVSTQQLRDFARVRWACLAHIPLHQLLPGIIHLLVYCYLLRHSGYIYSLQLDYSKRSFLTYFLISSVKTLPPSNTHIVPTSTCWLVRTTLVWMSLFSYIDVFSSIYLYFFAVIMYKLF